MYYDADRYRQGSFHRERAFANGYRLGSQIRETFAISDRDGLPYHRAADPPGRAAHRGAASRPAALTEVRDDDGRHDADHTPQLTHPFVAVSTEAGDVVLGLPRAIPSDLDWSLG